MSNNEIPSSKKKTQGVICIVLSVLAFIIFGQVDAYYSSHLSIILGLVRAGLALAWVVFLVVGIVLIVKGFNMATKVGMHEVNAEVVSFCVSCGAKAQSNDIFCKKCGTPIVQVGTNRTEQV